MSDNWNDAISYESYVGRWSRTVAPEFLKWVGAKQHLAWLDVGCGTGALSETILELYDPKKLTGIDSSESHVAFAKKHFEENNSASFLVGDAAKIPLQDKTVDVVVSGLVLNFIPGLEQALTEFKRVCNPDGIVCAYVWDYAGKMEMMRYFWDAAVSLSEDAKVKDEAVRFPVCNPSILKELFQSAGFADVETTFIDVATIFKDFDDFWKPFLSGQAPAPGYCMSLPEDDRQQLKQKIFKSLPIQKDGSIHLIARAIGIKALNGQLKQV